MPPEDPKARFKIPAEVPLRTLLSASLAVLVVLAVAPVIAVGYFFATNTAGRLLADRAELVVDGLENEIRGLLDPVVGQLGYARQAVMEGRVDPSDREGFRSFMRGLLGGTPQVTGIGHLRPDLSMRRWERAGFTETLEPPERLPLAAEAIEAARDGRIAYWSAPFVSPVLGDTTLSYRVALEHEGDFLGLLVSAVTSESLSRYVAKASRDLGATAFVLVGGDRILTHPARRAPEAAVTSTELPLLGDVEDPVIAGIWDAPNAFSQIDQPTRSQGHWSWIGDVSYVYLYRALTDYGPEPLIVAVALPAADSRRDRWASTLAAGVGVVLMLLAAAVAWRLGRALSRPAGAFDRALASIASLEFDKVALPALVDSRVREWRTVARRLEGTARALSAFQTYLPRALVRRLFHLADRGVESREREITVMFIDLEGFTGFARGRAADEVAAHLNAVFALVGPIIEASGGVIDKYTGDGLLAFWGAPDEQPDHALRACRAAAEVARALEAGEGETAGEAPRMRIGLHCGAAIVGNIGFAGRINYTLVGDTVNVAQRTESALRGVAAERCVVIGATAAVLEAQGGEAPALVEAEALEQAPQTAFRCLPADPETR